MKTFLLLSTAAIVSLGSLAAQDFVTAGTIRNFFKETGTIEIVPENRATTAFSFRGVDKAPIYYASGGGRAHVSELAPGRGVTIHHNWTGKQWVISKVSLAQSGPEGLPAGLAVDSPALPTAERYTIYGKAFQDRDVTTQPGAKANIDRDITTQPGSKATTDRDITTQPGSKATIDRDITTQPGTKAGIDRDRTTVPPGIANRDRDITTHADRRADKTR
jgi:hypothetical protein